LNGSAAGEACRQWAATEPDTPPLPKKFQISPRQKAGCALRTSALATELLRNTHTTPISAGFFRGSHVAEAAIAFESQ
jgi:hypothetical protein